MSRVLYEPKVGTKFIENINVLFPSNGTSNPVAANIVTTQECTITYAATGKYTYTFTRPYTKVFKATAEYNLATANGNYAQIDSKTSSSGVLVVVVGIYTNAGVAAAPAAAATNNEVMLDLVVGF